MGVAITLESFLKTKAIDYELKEHSYTEGSFHTAQVAEVPSHHLVKGVVFRDEDLHYTMAVIPADHRILRHTLNQLLDRHLEMADEDELDDIFFDCEHGAIPSFGQAYGLNIIWDESLSSCSDLWIEAGDHEHLIHLNSQDFQRLMKNHMHDHISVNRHHNAQQ